MLRPVYRPMWDASTPPDRGVFHSDNTGRIRLYRMTDRATRGKSFRELRVPRMTWQAPSGAPPRAVGYHTPRCWPCRSRSSKPSSAWPTRPAGICAVSECYTMLDLAQFNAHGNVHCWPQRAQTGGPPTAVHRVPLKALDVRHASDGVCGRPGGQSIRGARSAQGYRSSHPGPGGGGRQARVWSRPLHHILLV